MIKGIPQPPLPEDACMGDDGLMHCKVCGDKLQTIVKLNGKETKVRCICSCVEAARAERAETERKNAIERKRRECFGRAEHMKEWTFENDDCQNPKLSSGMRTYAETFPEFLQEGRGLLLFGTVGTGKTYYAACIANELIDKGYRVLMTNFAQLANRVFDGKEEYIESLNKYSLLIIDDLGIERSTEYMQETVYSIIDARYRAKLPMVITTNLTGDEIKHPKEIGYARIYDRLYEMCYPLEVEGKSRRRQELVDSYEVVKERLGMK